MKPVDSFLNYVERVGNKLPDPVMLFVIGLGLVWGLSALLSPVAFTELDPRTGEVIQVYNLLSGDALAEFLSSMVKVFVNFAPLGVVLVAMLGVGVAEHSGYINTGLKYLLSITPKQWLTPMLILVAIASHTAVDAGYVLVIPIGGIIFHAAGRHPLAGIAAAFAGVSGGFGANFIPSGIDPLLQGFTQSAAQIIDPTVQVNPLCNYYFASCSSLLIVLIGWYLTDKVIEPRLQGIPVDSDIEEPPNMGNITSTEKKAFFVATGVMLLGLMLLGSSLVPADSPFRTADGDLTSFSAPIMRSIVPLIFLLFAIPGVIYGYMAKTFERSNDVIQSMKKSIDGMSYYIVMVFFCALFVSAFGKSNLGALLAIKGADVLKSMALPGQVTIVGIIFLTAGVNLFIGSASAKWALISPIFVPMLMQVNISPELIQAAYRIGDSSSNIVTPLMPYFPLVVVFCQRYVKSLGVGTLISMMLPYTVSLLIGWSLFLLMYWTLELPLGLQASYVFNG